MIVLQVSAGAIAGLIAGSLVWWLANHFVTGYRSQPIEPGLSEAEGIPLPAALSVAGMALWGGWVGWRAADWTVAAFALATTAVLLCIAIVDFRARRIPNALVLTLLALAAAQILLLGRPTLQAAALGLALGGGVFLLLRLFSRGAMGMGDVKLEAAVGALTGYPAVLGAMFLGVVIGGLVALTLLLARRVGRKTSIAYGPYLALGAWLVFTRMLGLWP